MFTASFLAEQIASVYYANPKADALIREFLEKEGLDGKAFLTLHKILLLLNTYGVMRGAELLSGSLKSVSPTYLFSFITGNAIAKLGIIPTTSSIIAKVCEYLGADTDATISLKKGLKSSKLTAIYLDQKKQPS